MRRKSAKLLEDIRDAAEFILGLTRDESLESYRADRVVRQTVERNRRWGALRGTTSPR